MNDPRLYVLSDGRTYLVRDVLPGQEGLAIKRCEYGVYADGRIRWTPCEEGSAWHEIEPFLMAHSIDPADESV